MYRHTIAILCCSVKAVAGTVHTKAGVIACVEEKALTCIFLLGCLLCGKEHLKTQIFPSKCLLNPSHPTLIHSYYRPHAACCISKYTIPRLMHLDASDVYTQSVHGVVYKKLFGTHTARGGLYTHTITNNSSPKHVYGNLATMHVHGSTWL